MFASLAGPKSRDRCDKLVRNISALSLCLIGITAGGFNDTDVAVPTEYADMAALLGSYDSLSLFEGIYESLGVDAIASNAYTKTIFVPTEAIEIFLRLPF